MPSQSLSLYSLSPPLTHCSGIIEEKEHAFGVITPKRTSQLRVLLTRGESGLQACPVLPTTSLSLSARECRIWTLLNLFSLTIYILSGTTQLDSPRVSCASHTQVLKHAHTCTRTSTPEYSNMHTWVLTRVLKLARTHTRTRAQDSRAVDTLATQALHFLSGWERPGYRHYRIYRYAFAYTACAHYSHAHTCDVHCTRMRSNIHTRVARASHASGFRVTHEWTRVDRQVAREWHCKVFTGFEAQIIRLYIPFCH